jgi:uncharacterized OB-fold protein
VTATSALPDFDFDPTREFWQAAQREELVIPRCDGCGRLVWYPAPRCPDCSGEALSWTRVSGEATLFSWAVVRRALFRAFAEKAPYTTGLVALREDPRVRLVTTLVDCAPDELQVDMPVELVFRRLEFPGAETSPLAPMFRPLRRTVAAKEEA